jgi:hypothetical protein
MLHSLIEPLEGMRVFAGKQTMSLLCINESLWPRKKQHNKKDFTSHSRKSIITISLFSIILRTRRMFLFLYTKYNWSEETSPWEQFTSVSPRTQDSHLSTLCSCLPGHEYLWFVSRIKIISAYFYISLNRKGFWKENLLI